MPRLLRPSDLKPGTRFKWTPAAFSVLGLRAALLDIPCTITSSRPVAGTWAYRYDPTPAGQDHITGARDLIQLCAYAELIEPPEPVRCMPGCCPASPCMVGDACGGNGPEYSSLDYQEWASLQTSTAVAMECGPAGWAPMEHREEWREPARGPEPMRNGSGALACDWIERSRRG